MGVLGRNIIQQHFWDTEMAYYRKAKMQNVEQGKQHATGYLIVRATEPMKNLKIAV